MASLTPSGLDFTQPTVHATFRREHLVLKMHYIDTKILINPPCLCRLDDRIVAESTSAPSIHCRGHPRTTSQCATTGGDVNITGLRDTELDDHAAFEHREASSDAAVD